MTQIPLFHYSMKTLLRCLAIALATAFLAIVWLLNQERLRTDAIARLEKGGWDIYFKSGPARPPLQRRLWAWLNPILPPKYLQEVEGLSAGGGTQAQMQMADSFRHIPGIQGVFVANSQYISTDFLARLSALRSLRRLNFDGTNVTDEMLASFAAAPQIESITLVVTESLHGSGLRRFTGLKELVVHDSHFDDSGIPAVAHLQHLTSLDLEITDITPEVLLRLTDMPALKTLGLTKKVFKDHPRLAEFQARRPNVAVTLH